MLAVSAGRSPNTEADGFSSPVRGGVSSRAVAVAASAAAALTIGWRFFSFVGFSNDHYVISARALQMLLGEWPIRDFADPGMPLMYPRYTRQRGRHSVRRWESNSQS